METNTEIHSQTTYRERELGTHSSKWNVSIKSLFSELREPHEREGKEAREEETRKVREIWRKSGLQDISNSQNPLLDAN